MTEPLLEFTDRERVMELQDRNNTTNSESQPHSSANVNNSRDLVDTFDLFKNYLDHKLLDFKSDLFSQQDSLSKKYREEVNLKFKNEGNRIQFRFNEEILEGLHKLYKHLAITDKSIAATAAELIGKIKDRNKLIRIADSSAAGWATVREYEASDIADNEEDEKKIRQAESRALRKEKNKQRPQPYARPQPIPTPSPRAETMPNPAYANMYVRNQPPFRQGAGRREPSTWDICHLCKQPGHWRKDCPLNYKFQVAANTVQLHK